MKYCNIIALSRLQTTPFCTGKCRSHASEGSFLQTVQANEDQSEPIEKNGLKCGWLSAAEAVAGNVISLSTGSKCVPQHSSQSSVKSTSLPFQMASRTYFPNSHNSKYTQKRLSKSAEMQLSVLPVSQHNEWLCSWLIWSQISMDCISRKVIVHICH